MRVLIAGVTAERQYASSFKTFLEIERREDDDMVWQHGTRGDVARTIVGERFLASPQFDALLMCDLDQKFPKDTLEILRAQDKDIVSGHYMKRTTRGMTSIWQASVFPCDWPYLPFIDPPRDGLHRIGMTGMGCVLIKREVIEAVGSILPPGASPFEIGKLPDAAIAQGNFGSDYRFFYLAQKLGYELWGTTEVDTPHASTLWITRDTIFKLQKQRKEAIDSLTEGVFLQSIRQKGMITANAVASRIIQLEETLRSATSEKQEGVINGQLIECRMWLEELKANSPSPVITDRWRKIYDPTFTTDIRTIGSIEEPMNLPTFDNRVVQHEIDNRETAITGESKAETEALRQHSRRKQSMAGAQNINRMNALVTSTEPGEMESV
jgi:hypothetical protein